MNKSISLAAFCAAMLFSRAASAQTRYFSRVGLPKAAEATAAAAQAKPKTLVCSSMRMGFTVYPADLVQNVGTAASVADALALCNQFGAQYGEALKSMTYCQTQYDAQQKHWFTQLYKGTLVDVGYDDWSRTNRSVGSCVYNP